MDFVPMTKQMWFDAFRGTVFVEAAVRISTAASALFKEMAEKLVQFQSEQVAKYVQRLPFSIEQKLEIL